MVALSLADIYDGFTGPPWNMGQFYRILAKKHPAAKFVLTVRPAKEWVASFRRFTDQQRAFFNTMAGGDGAKFFGREYHSSGLDAKDSELIAVYRSRCNAVERFFEGTGRLFGLDWRKFRWGPLCEFLEVPPVPDDVLHPKLRRWEQMLNGNFRYMANPPRSHRKDDDEKPLIHFTVSMWNRAAHVEKLCHNIQLIANVDKRIALHVAFFDSDDIHVDDARKIVESLDLPSRLLHLRGEFNNGRGHNEAAKRGGVMVDEIVCPITVDLRLPLDICERIRANVSPTRQFYGPKVNNEDEAGRQHRGDYAYSLVAMYGRDFVAMGGLAENRKWGGDRDEKPEGGEDVVMCRRLRKLGLEEIRPYERDLVCRWHSRDITRECYSSLKKYKEKPWWTFTDSKGKPAKFPQ